MPALVIILAYLIGSIPFGYLIVRMKSGGDVRQTGSGGTGATNVSRRAGRAAGVVTLIFDALKGAIAVAVARVLLNAPTTGVNWLIAAAAVAVIAGHIFPVWLKFRGGKGVATGAGVFLLLAPFALLCAGIVFVAVVSLTRYVSLGSVVGAALIPVFVWLQHLFIQPVGNVKPLVTTAVAGAVLIVFAHRANIRRLVSGTESKFS